jgi:hypothetical protein
MTIYEDNVAAVKKVWLEDFIKDGARHCPNKKCRSENIEGQIDDQMSFYAVPIKCYDCGATWTNVFDVVKATNLEIPGVL